MSPILAADRYFQKQEQDEMSRNRGHRGGNTPMADISWDRAKTNVFMGVSYPLRQTTNLKKGEGLWNVYTINETDALWSKKFET